MRLARRAHLVLSFLFVGGVVVQVFLAGLGVFDSPATFRTHANWGYLLEIIPLILLALAVVGGLGGARSSTRRPCSACSSSSRSSSRSAATCR